MTSKRKPSPTKLAIAVEGEGLAPKDIPLRCLTELLEAAAATFEALAAEKQIDPPGMSLAKVTSGSARCALGIERIRRRKPQSSFMAAIEEARQSMTGKGIVYDSTKILAEDEDDGTEESDRG